MTIGNMHEYNFFNLRYSAGISYMKGGLRGAKIERANSSNTYFESNAVSTFALPININATYKLSNDFGIGLSAFQELNPQHSNPVISLFVSFSSD